MACDKICRMRREIEPMKLRDEDGNVVTPRQVDLRTNDWRLFGDNVAYTSSCVWLIDELDELHTREAVSMRLGLMMKAARLFRDDDENKMDILCALFRLGRHSEFYSLVKSHIRRVPSLVSDNESILQEWLDTKDEPSDPFENVEWLIFPTSKFHVDIILLVILLKVNMLYDLVAMETTTNTAGYKVPREILDNILTFVSTTSVIADNPEFIPLPEHTERIETLRDQIQQLYWAILQREHEVWKAVVERRKVATFPSPGCDDFPFAYRSTIKCGPYYSVGFWHANPWALEYISKLGEASSAS